MFTNVSNLQMYQNKRKGGCYILYHALEQPKFKFSSSVSGELHLILPLLQTLFIIIIFFQPLVNYLCL